MNNRYTFSIPVFTPIFNPDVATQPYILGIISWLQIASYPLQVNDVL